MHFFFRIVKNFFFLTFFRIFWDSLVFFRGILLGFFGFFRIFLEIFKTVLWVVWQFFRIFWDSLVYFALFQDLCDVFRDLLGFFGFLAFFQDFFGDF